MEIARKMHFVFSLLTVLIAVVGLLEGTPYLRQTYAWVQHFASQEKTEYKFALVLKKGELDKKIGKSWRASTIRSNSSMPRTQASF